MLNTISWLAKEAELLLNRNLRNLLHIYEKSALGKVDEKLLDEVHSNLWFLQEGNWDAELVSLELRLQNFYWYADAQERLSEMLGIERRSLKEVNPTDLEKIYTLIELIHRKEYHLKEDSEFKSLAEDLTSALAGLRRNNFEVPGMKIL